MQYVKYTKMLVKIKCQFSHSNSLNEEWYLIISINMQPYKQQYVPTNISTKTF